MTDTLSDFLLARIGEDEQAALAASPGPWTWVVGDGHYEGEPSGTGDWGHLGPDLMSGTDEVVTSRGYDGDNVIVTRVNAEHIARHDPARVLADCAAKRATIEQAAVGAPGRNWAMIRVLLLLAQPFATHPDFKPEWATLAITEDDLP